MTTTHGRCWAWGRLGAVAVGVQLFTGCLDDRAAPNEGGKVVNSSTRVQGEPSDLQAIQRFTIEVGVTGSYRPGQPLTVVAKVRGNLPTDLARIGIALPDLAAVQVRGRVVNGTRLPSVLSVERAVAKGELVVQRKTIRIPQPGYYRIAVSANAIRSAPVERGLYVQDGTLAEVWVYIDQNRGRLTRTMDPSVFGSEEYQVPGPRQARKLQAADRDFSAAALGCTWRIRYVDNLNLNWPVQDAEVQVSGSRTFVLRTDSNGAFNLCPAPGETFSFTANYRNPDVFMVANPAAQVTGITSTTPGRDVIAPVGLDARAYENLVRTVGEARALFTYSRARVTAQVWDQSTTHYTDDKILINIGDVWNEWGIFAAAHEYGHAYHKHALGGYTSGTCPSPHYLDQATNNVQCAWAEGFADFFGVATRRTVLTRSDMIGDYRIEFDYYFPGRNYSTGATSRDGALIEGAVAAFLYDIIDDASWPDGPANEVNGDEDFMAYGGKYLADVIRTCANQMPVVSFPTTSYQWQNEYHIGMLDNCLENRVSPPPPQPTLNLGGAIAQRESATEPSGWSPTTLRDNWTWNLMTKP